MENLNRREFLSAVGAGAAGMGALTESSSALSAPGGGVGRRIGKPLRVQPALVYHLYKRKEAQTWREWGGLRTQADVDGEIERINGELEKLSSDAEYALEILPLEMVNSDAQAARVRAIDCDVMLIYAAGAAGPGIYRREWLEQLRGVARWNVMFLRHKSGPVYLWYEIAHPTFLRKGTDVYKQKGMDVWDIVVDEYDELLWRLRALYGLKNITGSRIVAVGGPQGWHHPKAGPEAARKYFRLDIRTVDYSEFTPRLRKKMGDASAVTQAEQQAKEYLSGEGVKEVKTKKQFVVNAFLLRNFLKELMAEHECSAVTINNCMNIGKIAETTACLAFSLINDEGLMAFCESDFVVIPSGILLRHISRVPVFMNDPTFPHNGLTTCAHCSAPRRMNGKDLEDVRILTHYESDYGAAPKVEFAGGQQITVLVPNFDSTKWMGFRAKIIEAPFYAVCRSQMDIEIEGNWQELLEDMHGFHWMICYGDYVREVGYALKKVGIKWDDLTSSKAS